jgi:sorbitol-specific phosphotransferase system component IIA
MKKIIAVTAAILALSSPIVVLAADHSGHTTKHKPASAHEEVVDGVKATFNVQTMADAMKAMGMEMPNDVKETHHISVTFKDAGSGKALTEGTVTVKVQNPDKTAQTKEFVGMHGHFGADFDFAKSGKYGVMCKFQLKDGKIRQAKFWYEVKGAK